MAGNARKAHSVAVLSDLTYEWCYNERMKVSEIGEFGLIDLLQDMVDKFEKNQPPNPRLLIGIGDDAAAWHVSDKIQLATVDTMVENVHFTLDTITFRQLGWKALAMNISDIVAMAGVPDYALIAVTLPENIEVDNVRDFYQGVLDLCGTFGMTITGGNISRAPLFSVSITVLGSGREDVLLKRSAAKPGDAVAVTGYPGDAAAGLEMLMKNLNFNHDVMEHLHFAFLHPFPRMVEAQALVKNGVKAAIDISDGLVSDLEHICQASQVGAHINIDTLPVSSLAQEAFGNHARELALSGGEAYELLFTGPLERIQQAMTEITLPVTVIGEITADNAGEVKLVDSQGSLLNFEDRGWRHF